MEKKRIITHRGLEPSSKSYYSESSYEAFSDHVARGFGIEFDVQPLKDGKIIVSHNLSLTRITGGKDTRQFSEIESEEIARIKLQNGSIPFLTDVLGLLNQGSAAINALHLKGGLQQEIFLSKLIEALFQYERIFPKLLVFDAKPETAKILKKVFPKLSLAPSVVHEYDKKRFNTAVHGTLLTMEEAIEYKKEGLYDWAWLDEWDRKGENNSRKKLYSQKTFLALRNAGFSIALVTPELHATSPGLLGNESHEDAANRQTLFKRIAEIIALEPDALCTDYPEEVSLL